MFKRFMRWLFPKITSYRFENQALQNMREMALQTHPKEAFGLLSGKHKGSTLVIDKIIFQPFENTSYTAVARIDPTLTGIVGSFHSHPSPNAFPSRADRRMFSKYPGVHCILASPYTEAAVYNQHGEFLGIETIAYP